MNIRRACQTLNVSKAGFYEFLKRKPSKRKKENELLKEEIATIFQEHHGRYGAIRITKVLNKKGILVNRKRVGKLLHQLGLYAKGSTYKYKYYNRKSPSLSRPDLINQTFKATEKNKIWLGDITYIPLKEGTLYLSVFIDVCTRKIVGWSMSPRMKDQLVVDSFLQAFGKEQPGPGLIIHTDQGSQYTGTKFQSVLRKKEARASMSRKGNPYDNALMESFYKTLKRELINDAQFNDIDQAQMEIFKYIETYYNTKRIHSALGYQSPRAFEKKSAYSLN